METVMKKRMTVSIALAVGLSLIPISQASAKTFKNCTELNKVHPGGVARPGAVNKGGATKLTPKYDKKLYEANKKSDRDKDGIACEK
jgi:hypothetical protein